jgi:hypothetical protein
VLACKQLFSTDRIQTQSLTPHRAGASHGSQVGDTKGWGEAMRSGCWLASSSSPRTESKRSLSPRTVQVHLTVRPRAWWEERFRIAGCVRDEDTFRALQTYDIDGVTELSPRIFPFLCHLPPSPATSRPEVS